MDSSKLSTPILVTGATGFLGSHCVKNLLERGFKVRGTVRSLANKEKNQFLYDMVGENKDQLTLVEAELTKAEGWDEACKGIEYALHTASPIAQPGYTDEQYIAEATAGVDNFFNAALKQGIKKVTFTSSVAAIFYNPEAKVLNEEVWSEESRAKGYALSKLKAELLVQEIAKKNADKIHISCVQPGGIFGPALSSLHRTTLMMIAAFFNNYPGNIEGDCPLSIIDVRDCAEIHIRALFNDKSKNGERYMAINEVRKVSTTLEFLQKHYSSKGFTFPVDKTITVKEAFETKHPVVQYFASTAGKTYTIDNSKIVKDLGMKFVSADDTILDTVSGLVKFGILPAEKK